MLGLRKWRRARLRRRPLSDAQRRVLEGRVGWVRQLPSGVRQELEGLVQIFLGEKHFEGCGGLVVTDEMRLVIATQACILLLGRDTDVYPGLQTILVYPHAYLARVRSSHGGIVTEGTSVRIGEAWSRGSLVLAWDHVLRDAGDIHDGHNVVFHEFAHLLDLEDGAADGAPSSAEPLALPRLGPRSRRRLRRSPDRVAHHRPSVLDEYGTTAPAEFFAVATECFFEKPLPLERAYPALYEELRRFYRRDPAALERGEPERSRTELQMRTSPIVGALIAALLTSACAPRTEMRARDEGRLGSVRIFENAASRAGLVFLFSDASGWSRELTVAAERIAGDGALVVGVDLAAYLQGLRASDDGCHYVSPSSRT